MAGISVCCGIGLHKSVVLALPSSALVKRNPQAPSLHCAPLSTLPATTSQVLLGRSNIPPHPMGQPNCSSTEQQTLYPLCACRNAIQQQATNKLLNSPTYPITRDASSNGKPTLVETTLCFSHRLSIFGPFDEITCLLITVLTDDHRSAFQPIGATLGSLRLHTTQHVHHIPSRLINHHEPLSLPQRPVRSVRFRLQLRIGFFWAPRVRQWVRTSRIWTPTWVSGDWAAVSIRGGAAAKGEEGGAG